jgi:bisanhydrobacterioruberin hydratase
MNLKINFHQSSILSIYSILFIFGCFFHWFVPTRFLVIQLTETFLALSVFILLYLSWNFKQKFNLSILVFIYLFTLIIEIIGVKTGLIFGQYSYSNIWQVQIFNTPLLIGFNWILVVFGAICLVEKLEKLQVISNLHLHLNRYPINILCKSVAVGLIAVVFDLVLEPVAIKLNYWQWQNNIIPLQNYLAWFVVAFIASLVYYLFKLKPKNNLATVVLIYQYIFLLFIFFII